MSFDRFIRFVDENNVILYGNLLEALPSEKILGLEVEILSGNPKEGFSKTSQKATVVKESFSNPCSVTVLPNTKQLLNPLTNTPLVLCAGLNYHLHVEETKVNKPFPLYYHWKISLSKPCNVSLSSLRNQYSS